MGELTKLRGSQPRPRMTLWSVCLLLGIASSGRPAGSGGVIRQYVDPKQQPAVSFGALSLAAAVASLQ